MTENILTALIDCRPTDDYQRGHIAGACSLPATQLFQRMHELPKRHVPLRLCGSEHDVAMASAYLIDRGHAVTEQIVWSAALADGLKTQGQLELGARSRQLWQPAPLWQRFVTEIMSDHDLSPGRGLDIACGAGRDMVYLAQQGWEMTGVDQSTDALQRVTVLAAGAGVTVKTQQLDLETGSNPFTPFAERSFALVSVARYLHRPLFPWIRALLQPGGIIIYQTFLRGCEHTAVGRPRNPSFLLETGELSDHFAGFEVLVNEVEVLDDGRPMAAFIARQYLG